MNLQPRYTFRLRYTKSDNPDKWKEYIYCGDDNLKKMTTNEIIEYLRQYNSISFINTEQVEILDWCCNFFWGLFDTLSKLSITIINNGFNQSAYTPKQFAYNKKFEKDEVNAHSKLALHYISHICKCIGWNKSFNKYIRKGEEGKRDYYEEYRNKLLREILDNLYCYDYQINREAIKYIFGIFNINFNEETPVRTQIKDFLNPVKQIEQRKNILNSLTSKDNKPFFKSKLDKIYKRYHLGTETNRSKIATIVYKIMIKFNGFNSSIDRKYDPILKKLCAYWGIETPTFRMKHAIDYIDEDALMEIKTKKLEKKLDGDKSYLKCLEILDEGIWNFTY